MDTLSSLLTPFGVNPPVTGDFPSPANLPHKVQWRGALVFFFISARRNVWANNRNAGNLRRHCAHYVVTGMLLQRQRMSIGYPMNKSARQWLLEIIHAAVGHADRSIFRHYGVIKWKHFPRNWPFVRRSNRSRLIPHTKASDAELWCFLWSASE